MFAKVPFYATTPVVKICGANGVSNRCNNG